MNTALIIFVRNPVLGKVKSRLAATIGNEKALEIYKKLLVHTHAVSKNLPLEKYIFYEDFINENDLWENDVFHKSLQVGNDLGERMSNAFKKTFERGYRNAIIIGSDCFELTEKILLQAIEYLMNNDLVIGPATDGGYYLLGMKVFLPQLFIEKKWSTDNVFKQTYRQAVESGYSVTKLPVLNDVDCESDLPLF